MATHKAYRLHSYGGPSSITLDEVPIPTPGPSQILVQVHTVGLNPFDWKIREGYVKDHLPLQLPAVLGVDFVGTVSKLGSATSSAFKVGDRVMSMSTSLGAFAEHIVAEEKILARVPDSVDDTFAATLPIPAMSAWTALNTAGEIRSGMKILIHGASGIVGAFATQMAKARGAFVIGTASAKNKDYVLGLGADEFIDYQTEKFEDKVKDIDVVLDFVLVGGDRATTDRTWGVLKKGGAIVSLADPSTPSKAPEGYKGFFPPVEPKPEVLEDIARQLADGRLQSKVAQVFPRDDLVAGMEMNKRGGTTGRLIVDFRQI